MLFSNMRRSHIMMGQCGLLMNHYISNCPLRKRKHHFLELISEPNLEIELEGKGRSTLYIQKNMHQKLVFANNLKKKKTLKGLQVD
jgi:hypothetical protein